MNFLQKLNEIFLIEAIPMSLARPYIKKGQEVNYKSLYPELFTTGKDRVYFDFQPSDESTGNVFPKIQDYLSKKKFKIIDYKQGIAQEDKPPEEKEITDPQTKEKKKVKVQPQKIRIGVLLKDNPELQKEYNDDEIRGGSKTKQYSIVISRHPYDIAGMSTNRGWTSCMNLKGGCNVHKVIKDVEHGSLIAYLINANDKNIQNPLSRILLKPHYKEKSQSKMLKPDTTYGVSVPGFEETVEDIVDRTINKNSEEGVFSQDDTKVYYNDGEEGRSYLNDPSNNLYNKYLNEPSLKKIPRIIIRKYPDFLTQWFEKFGYIEKPWEEIPQEVKDYDIFKRLWGEKHFNELVNDFYWREFPFFFKQALNKNTKFSNKWLEKHTDRLLSDPTGEYIPPILLNDPKFNNEWTKKHGDRYIDNPWDLPQILTYNEPFMAKWNERHSK
jgi:hypothetical protein